jgi:hypothetical protein
MKKILFAAFFLVIGAGMALAQTNWELKADEDGIKVYASLVPGSKVKGVKVECQFDATPQQVAALLMDVKTSTDWVYHLKSAIVVKQVSPSELYYYSEVSLPWPAANRDFVAHLTVSQNPVTRVVTVDGPAVPGFVAEKKGIVRVNESEGKWIITPVGSDKVDVVYTLHMDPGGGLPSWLVNMFSSEAPLKIFKSMRTQLQKPVYKNSELAFVAN